jgi:predicted ABC-type ATPase
MNSQRLSNSTNEPEQGIEYHEENSHYFSLQRGDAHNIELNKPSRYEENTVNSLHSIKQKGNLLTALENQPKIASSIQELRAANRQVTLMTMGLQEQDIAKERKQLVARKYNSGISLREERRLKYLNWQLQRIDDARIGEHLDKLEMIVQSNERLAGELRHFTDAVSRIQNSQAKKKKR